MLWLTLLLHSRDANLRHTLPFGIGLHHAGLTRDDKEIVEELFASDKIQVLISTSTLAWGVNLPAHLVVIKGTEFFDPKTRRYLDFPITDVLQMMGRAGRPQYDTLGKAVIMVHEPKKNFYKKFLYEPFPVESSLPAVLHDHFNAEIISGTITSKQDAVDYLTWTYFFRRLLVNPTYYDLESTDFSVINRHLSESVDMTLRELEASHCIEIDENGVLVYPLTFGRIASFYYLHHTTMRLFYDTIGEDNSIEALLGILCNTSEYDDLPVRHNEEKLNEELAAHVRWPVDAHLLDDPHTKANLLLQAHFADLAMPISDYITDTKSVLDQSVRILQAMVDVAADGGWLFTSLNCMHLMQMVAQGQWHTESSLSMLSHVDDRVLGVLADEHGIESVAQLLGLSQPAIARMLSRVLSAGQLKEFLHSLSYLPIIDVKATVDTSFGQRPDVGNPKTFKQEEEDDDEDEETEKNEEVDDDDEGLVGQVEGMVKVELVQLNKPPSRMAFTPRFPKTKEAAWWLVLGDPQSGELLALRRLSLQRTSKTSLTFPLPDRPGHYTYWLYLMCDSYLGLDQQVPISFDI